MPTNVTSFEVQRGDLAQTRVVDEVVADIDDGQVLLRVDHFGFTSNNVTYGAFGDMLGYWHFFPAEGPWGRIPVWGFADVVESAHPDVPEGTRLYGYLPMSTHVVLQPAKVTDRDLLDGSPHRLDLPTTYNLYTRTDGDPNYDESRERERMLLWPLFFTAFLIDDFFADHDFWGAGSVVVSSASSKTSIGTAFFLSGREGLEVVGLTSAGNQAFVESLGVYDTVVTYDDVANLEVGPSIFVDIAGDAAVRQAVHARLDDQLVHSALVGGTHWDAPAVGDELAGPAPTFFFAPDQITARVARSGQAELDRLVGDAWARFLTWVDGWFTIDEVAGADAVQRTYLEVLAGRLDPARGLALAMA